MKALTCIVAAALMALTASAFHMQTVFTIPLPTGVSTTEFFAAGGGDMYYTVGTGGVVYAVNLTSKKIQYSQTFAGASEIGGILGLDGGYCLVDGDGDTFALDSTGQLLWTSGTFAVSSEPNTHTVSNGTLFVVSDEDGTLSAIDLQTGETIGEPITISGGYVFPTEAIVNTQDENGDNEVIAYSIPSLTKKWGLEVNAFLAQNDKYLLVSRTGPNSGNTDILILDPKSLGLIAQIKDADGVTSDNNYEIVGEDHFLAQLGYNGRIAYFDLKNGKKIWEFTPNSGGNGNGGGFAITNYSLVSISQTELHFINITDGKPLVTKKQVPYTSEHTITQFGPGLVQVINLQGYTTWNAQTGDYVSRDETSPNSTPSNFYHWGNYYVTTVGSNVLVQELVQ